MTPYQKKRQRELFKRERYDGMTPTAYYEQQAIKYAEWMIETGRASAPPEKSYSEERGDFVPLRALAVWEYRHSTTKNGHERFTRWRVRAIEWREYQKAHWYYGSEKWGEVRHAIEIPHWDHEPTCEDLSDDATREAA